MYQNVNKKLKQLPFEYQDLDISAVREQFLKSEKTIVVLDDDPTGTQTCYDVTVLTGWNVGLIQEELEKKPSILFILTNSRSLSEPDAIKLATEIGRNLKKAGEKSGRKMIVISRSDSTLRGHFPAEVDAVASALDMTEAVTVLIPAFLEGGRYTIDDIHYIAEKEELVPVSDTPFARDVVFGYQHADLKKWVEEKTRGRVRASQVSSISIEDIREGGPERVSEKLIACKQGATLIMNAASYRDLEVIAMGLMQAESAGKKIVYRTSATIVPIRAGLQSGKIYQPQHSVFRVGHLVIVGSHVPKTTSQLTWLLEQGDYKSIEVNVADILEAEEISSKAEAIVQQTDGWIAGGKNVVIHTSRRLEVGNDPESSLKINALVSDFLVSLVKGLTVRPKFIVAKGGITSSDLATKGLSAQKALILGPVIPGVPVWQMDEKSKFPGIIYVIFPGNVGDEQALLEVCKKFEG